MWSCLFYYSYVKLLLVLCEVKGKRFASPIIVLDLFPLLSTHAPSLAPPISRSFVHVHHSLSHVWSSIFSTTPAAPRGATTQRCLPSLAFYSFVSPPPSRSAAVTISPSIFAMFGNCARTAARCSAFSIPS